MDILIIFGKVVDALPSIVPMVLFYSYRYALVRSAARALEIIDKITFGFAMLFFALAWLHFLFEFPVQVGLSSDNGSYFLVGSGMMLSFCRLRRINKRET